jgi:hypothetical protein
MNVLRQLGNKIFGGGDEAGFQALSNNMMADNKEKEGYQKLSENMMSKKKGGKVSSASSRADGCCVKGKTKGRMV